MAVNVYARRYAKTIFRLALENKEVNRWQADLRQLAGLMQDGALVALLSNPQVTWEEKAKTLTGRLGEINQTALKLVSVLASKANLAVLGDIAGEYQRLVDNYHGIEGTETAEVITAVALDNDYQLKLAQRLTEIIGKPVVLRPKVDPAILGGIVIRVGDKLIDGSIRSKLEALRKELGGVAR